MSALQSFAEKATLPALKLGTLILLGYTWALTSFDKLTGPGVPPGFQEKFGETFLGQFPGIPASYYSIAILEAAAAALALAGLITGEFFRAGKSAFLRLSLVLSFFIFLQLGFGQRLTSDHGGAFNLYVYAALTALMLIGLVWLEEREAGEAS